MGWAIKRALRATSANATRWITRSMDEFEGLSASTMSNWFHLCGVTTHLTKTIKLSQMLFSPRFPRAVSQCAGPCDGAVP